MSGFLEEKRREVLVVERNVHFRDGIGEDDHVGHCPTAEREEICI